MLQNAHAPAENCKSPSGSLNGSPAEYATNTNLDAATSCHCERFHRCLKTTTACRVYLRTRLQVFAHGPTQNCACADAISASESLCARRNKSARFRSEELHSAWGTTMTISELLDDSGSTRLLVLLKCANQPTNERERAESAQSRLLCVASCFSGSQSKPIVIIGALC